MHFFRDSGVTVFCSCNAGIQYVLCVSSVLESSFTLCKLGFSALASCGYLLNPFSRPGGASLLSRKNYFFRGDLE